MMYGIYLKLKTWYLTNKFISDVKICHNYEKSHYDPKVLELHAIKILKRNLPFLHCYDRMHEKKKLQTTAMCHRSIAYLFHKIWIPSSIALKAKGMSRSQSLNEKENGGKQTKKFLESFAYSMLIFFSLSDKFIKVW